MDFQCLADRLRQLLRDEQGIALPTAIFATVATLGLAGAASFSSIQVQQGSQRDNGSKAAIAAADAGANVAIMRQNNYGSELSAEYPCLGIAGEEMVKLADDDPAEPGWCPEISGTVGGASYDYRVSAFGTDCGEHDVCVVATGSSAGVSRRIEMTLAENGLQSNDPNEPNDPNDPDDPEDPNPEEPEEPTGPAIEGLVGQDWVNLGGNADVRVGVGTNGNLDTSGNASVCGDIRIGVGKAWTKSGNAKQCTGYAQVEGNRELPPVTSFMPVDIATNNSNYRLVKCTSTSPTKVPAGCEDDTYVGGKRSSTKPWDPSSRTISASSNTTLTVGGGDYWICRLQLSGNSQFIMAAGARVRIFFDTPENCGLSSGTAQISLSGNNVIKATGYQPTFGNYDMPGFYLLGSTSRTTTVGLSGNYATTNELIVYAPNTAISITGNASYKGVLAGKTIHVSGNGTFSQDAGFKLPPELKPPTPPAQEDPEEPGDPENPDDESEASGVRTYSANSYVECSGVVVSPPNAGC